MQNFRTYLCRLALLGAMLVGTPVLAATDIIISNDNNAKGLKGQTFEVLKKELNTRLGNKVKVALHHSGTLFNQKTQVQGLQLGSVRCTSFRQPPRSIRRWRKRWAPCCCRFC